MPKTTLQLINSTLALIGEQPLLSSAGNLGDLTRDAINTALVNVAQETRANIFETTIQVNATNNDYLVPALTLPATVLQVFTVSLRQSTGSSFGDNLIQLEYLPLEAITSEPSYSLSGSNLYLSPTIGRPATVFLRALQSFSLPASDVTDSGLPDVVIPAVQHVAASILALSYLDDPNQAAIQQRIAQSLLDKLKSQYGVSRAKAFNVSGQRRTAGFGSGGVSNISGAVQYAPLNSPALTGNPTAPTPAVGDNDTSIATTAFVKAQRTFSGWNGEQGSITDNITGVITKFGSVVVVFSNNIASVTFNTAFPNNIYTILLTNGDGAVLAPTMPVHINSYGRNGFSAFISGYSDIYRIHFIAIGD